MKKKKFLNGFTRYEKFVIIAAPIWIIIAIMLMIIKALK